jgi:hypothetical protein
MKSPFPGMDPYLERHWRDAHADFVSMSRRALNKVLPGDLVARMEERVVIDSIAPERARAIYPDVGVYEDPAASAEGQPPAGGASVAEPIVLELETEEHTEAYITILDADGGELVTVVEFLSPTNKLPGPGRDEYRRKRDDLRQARVNLVEIDLIRQGSWRDLLRPIIAPARAETEYRALVRRQHPRRRIELYPMSIRSPLPILPIPLRDSDADVPLDLQAVFEEVYAGGRYDHTDYRTACEPPLAGDLAEWAGKLIGR